MTPDLDGELDVDGELAAATDDVDTEDGERLIALEHPTTRMSVPALAAAMIARFITRPLLISLRGSWCSRLAAREQSMSLLRRPHAKPLQATQWHVSKCASRDFAAKRLPNRYF